MIVSVLLVVGILSLLVFVHELGHFVLARRSGVIVEEFGFGLPPRIWGFKRGGTVYSINLFPLGGFVRLKGENSSDKGPGTFASARFKSKIKILLAGVAMNALVGYLLLLYLTLTGLPPIPNFDVNLAGTNFARGPEVMLLNVSPDSAAAKAGLKRGDVVLQGNGLGFSSEDDIRAFTLANSGKEVSLRVRRGRQTFDQSVKLDKGTKDGGQLGALPFKSYLAGFSLPRAIVLSAVIFWKVAIATVLGFLGLIVKLPALIVGTFGHTTPDVAATGPVGITAILSNILFMGYRFILLVVVSITISLAVINALPIPALDGGRVMLISLSKFGKRDLSRKLEAGLHGAGFAFLILIIVLITILDVRRFF